MPRFIRFRPWMLTLAIGCVYFITKPASTDLMAQRFRAWLFEQEGFTLWNNAWFGGHTTLSYSIFAPIISGTIGVYGAGVVAATVAAGAFTHALDYTTRERKAAIWWFAVVIGLHLWTGRTTFSLGVAFGLIAWSLAKKERLFLASFMSVIAMFTSPVAGLFLLLTTTAEALAVLVKPSTKHLFTIVRSAEFQRWLVVTLIAGFALLAVKFFSGNGGKQPFVASAFWPAFCFSALFLYFQRRHWRSPLSIGTGLFVCLLVLAFLMNTPLGGNTTRFVELFFGPAVLFSFATGGAKSLHRVAMALLLAACGYWATYQPLRSWQTARKDPASKAHFYAPLITYFKGQRKNVGPFRVEVVPSNRQGEAFFVARSFPLARGWERQTDRKYSHLLYQNKITATQYRAWLDQNQVRYIALPRNVKLDEGAHAEAELLRHPPVWLQRVWQTDNWQVWEKTNWRQEQNKPPIIKLTLQTIEMKVDQPQVFEIGLRYTQLWQVKSSAACLENHNGWLRLHAKRAGVVKLYLSRNPFTLFQHQQC